MECSKMFGSIFGQKACFSAFSRPTATGSHCTYISRVVSCFYEPEFDNLTDFGPVWQVRVHDFFEIATLCRPKCACPQDLCTLTLIRGNFILA